MKMCIDPTMNICAQQARKNLYFGCFRGVRNIYIPPTNLPKYPTASIIPKIFKK